MLFYFGYKIKHSFPELIKVTSRCALLMLRKTVYFAALHLHLEIQISFEDYKNTWIKKMGKRKEGRV